MVRAAVIAAVTKAVRQMLIQEALKAKVAM